MHEPFSGPSASSNRTRIAVAVVEHQGRFLVGVRPEGVPLAGYWEFPGGKIAEGERPSQAAARECLEETGLTVAVGRCHLRASHDYEHDCLELHFFAAQPINPEQEPRSPFRWVARQELSALRFPAANEAVLSILLGQAED